MSVDITGIETVLCRVVSGAVGDHLSTQGTGVNEKPSVIKSRSYASGTRSTSPVFPDYPYISVDYSRITDEGYELSERYYDENDNYVYRTHKLVSYSVKVFGTSQDDVFSICNELHMKLEMDNFRDLIRSESPTEASLRSKSDIVFTAAAMEDKYREVASFDILLAVIDEVSASIVDVPPIENVVINTAVPVDGFNGGLYESPEDTAPLLDVDVETTVTYP